MNHYLIGDYFDDMFGGFFVLIGFVQKIFYDFLSALDYCVGSERSIDFYILSKLSNLKNLAYWLLKRLNTARVCIYIFIRFEI